MKEEALLSQTKKSAVEEVSVWSGRPSQVTNLAGYIVLGVLSFH